MTLPPQGSRIQNVQFLADGSRLLVAARPNRVSEWIVDQNELVTRIRDRGLARHPSTKEQAKLEQVKGR